MIRAAVARRLFDARSLRALERVVAAVRERRRSRRADRAHEASARPSDDVRSVRPSDDVRSARPSDDVRSVRPIEARAAARWTVRRLEEALGRGAYGEAAELAEMLLARIDLLSGAERGDAVAAALGSLLSMGERERAYRIVAAEATALDASVAGASVLEVLRARAPRALLPNGAPSPLGLARLVEDHAIDADWLRSFLLARVTALVANPELHLLVANARRFDDRAGAVAALDRYLRVFGLEHVESRDGAGAFLADLRFDAPPPRHGPLVSILVAAYRAGSTLDYAIDSLLAQSYRDIEVLIGDDASGDDSVERLRARHRGDPRVRVFTSVANQGAYNLRNQLARHARGGLLAFHDADDLALPGRIAAQVEHVNRTGAVATYATWLRVTEDGRFVFFRDRAARRLCLSSLVVRRSAFEAVGGFRAVRFGADFELRARLERGGGVEILRRPLVLGLWSSASITRAAGAEALEDGFRAPARRRYAELVACGADDAELDRALRETGNWVAPAALREITA